MGYLGIIKLDANLTFTINTYTPATGAAVDADAVPSYRIYEDETAGPLLTGNMALLDDANTTGFYSEQVAISTANGFEPGKSYTIRIASIVGGVTIVKVHQFDVTEADLDDLGALIGSIGSGTGAAMNFAADDDNVDGAIAGAPVFAPLAPFVGVETTPSFLNTAAEDGTYHRIDDTANEIDIIYQFSIGAGRNAAKVVFKGYMGTSTSDTCVIKAYNFITGAWDTRATLIGQTGSANVVKDMSLLSNHTGTGIYGGKVYIRFDSTATNQVLWVDELLVAGVSVGMTTGYQDGAVWVKAAGIAASVAYVNGTADNPCPWANAQVVAGLVGLTRFRIVNGETVTLTGAITNKSLIGKNWSLALAAQVITDAYIEGAYVSGISSGTDAQFVDCHFDGTATMGGGHYDLFRCGFGVVTFTMLANSSYNLVGCYDDDPDTATSPVFVFAANSVVGARNWRGAFQVSSMAGGNKLTIDGAGRLIITDTSVGGAITIRGFFPPITGGAGLHTAADFVTHGGTITQTTRYDTDQVRDSMKLAPTAGVPAAGSVDAHLDDILDDTGTAGVIVAAASKTGYELSAGGIDSVWDEVIKGTITGRQMLSYIGASVLGKISGGGTATVTFRHADDSGNAIVATVDINGNRTVMVLTP